MSRWRSARANRVLGALRRIGWTIKRQTGSHKVLTRPGWADFVFAFHASGGAPAERFEDHDGNPNELSAAIVPAYSSLDDLDPLDYKHIHVHAICRTHMGERAGVGTLETIVFGRHDPSGFKSLLDGAP